MANFIALKVARDAKAGWDIGRTGSAAGPPLGLHVHGDLHRLDPRRGHARAGAGNVRKIPVGRTTGSGSTSLGRSPRTAAGIRPFAVVANGGRSRPASWIRSRRSRRSAPTRTSGSTSTPRTAAGDARRRPASPVRRDRARRLGRVRPAQVAVHAPVGRLRGRPRPGADAARVRRRLRRVRRQGRGAHRLGRRPRSALAQLQPGVLGAEGVGVAARAREDRYGADLPRRGARSVPRRARGGARRVRADDAGRLSITCFRYVPSDLSASGSRRARPVGTRTSTSSTTG